MTRGLKLHKLLDRRAISAILADWSLDYGVHLGLLDDQGHLVVGNLPNVPEELRDQLSSGRAWTWSAEPLRGTNWVSWPLLSDQAVLGALVAMSPADRAEEQAAPHPSPAQAPGLPTDLETKVRPWRGMLALMVSEGIAKRAIAQETLERYREINLLYNIGETIGACLDMEELCQLVLDESVNIINARRGAVMLLDEGVQDLQVAVSLGIDELSPETRKRAQTLALGVVRSGKPQIVNGFARADGSRMPIVCAPLRFRDTVSGAIILSEKQDDSDFTAGDEKLLLALASQAAVAIENARLFEDVKRQRDEIATMKSYMDNIFASVASGVITTDINDIVTTFNRAAESILAVPSDQVLNRPYYRVMAFLRDTALPSLIDNVRRLDQTYIDYEICPSLPERGQVHLNMSLSRLRSTSDEPLGVTIVVDDVTEKKRFERELAMVRRYLPTELLDNLPDDLTELGLRGERQVITTLFADIRGFTGFSEANSPETVVEVINLYFAMAERAVRDQRGIIDKYLGDAVMAVFNTPLLQIEDHAWKAVRAAWRLKQAVERYHTENGSGPANKRLDFGIGICTGEAVVGNVGAVDRMEYTAIGDSVNVAKRLQENAASGQIILSRSTWELIKDLVMVEPMSPIRVKGRQTPVEVFELVGLKQ